MKKSLTKLLILSLFFSFSWADLDCPADEAVHVDTRTMLPDGSPNPHTDKKLSQVSVVV